MPERWNSDTGLATPTPGGRSCHEKPKRKRLGETLSFSSEQPVTDSESDRITRLETRVDALRDVLERDLRAVFPLVRENGEMRKTLEHVESDVRELRTGVTEAIHEFRRGLDELEERLAREAKERQQVREAREAEERKEKARAEQDREERAATERRDRWARWLPTVAVIVAIVVGVIDQL